MKLFNLKGALSIQTHYLVFKIYSQEEFERNLILPYSILFDYETLPHATGNECHQQKRYIRFGT